MSRRRHGIDAFWRYISNIFIPSETDTNIKGRNRNDRPKRFWSFMKNLRRDSSGVPCLSENGILETCNKVKADILADSFGLYTPERMQVISL